MNHHCSDDELLLEYYEESSAHLSHLSGCQQCAARYRELKTFLDSLALEPPERGDHYGLEVWQQIRHRLPAQPTGWRSLLVNSGFLGRRRWDGGEGTSWTQVRLAFAAVAAVVLMATGFVAGRLWPRTEPVESVAHVAAPSPVSADEDARRRVVLMTVADHLDRSHRVLADIMNASGTPDLSAEQQWASDLVAASRLYRQDVVDIEEPAVAAVLEELERALLDIVHQPARATDADLEEIRRRIDSAALLFKVRVLTNELQQRLDEPAPALASSSNSTIG